MPDQTLTSLLADRKEIRDESSTVKCPPQQGDTEAQRSQPRKHTKVASWLEGVSQPSVLSPIWTGPRLHHLLVKSYVAVTKWMPLMSDFQVITFLSHFPFYFQETNSLSNYQFLFQDLAITTLIGITSKTFLKLPLLPSVCFPLPRIQRGKEEIGLLLLRVGLKEKC